jgi:hypothetical protein
MPALSFHCPRVPCGRRSASAAVIAVAAVLLAAVPQVAGAQVWRDSAVPARAPLVLDGTGLSQGRYTYEAVLERGGDLTVIGQRTVDVIGTVHAGQAAWLLLEMYQTPLGPFADSLWVDRFSLRPLQRGALHGDTRLSTVFRSDSAFGGVSGPLGRRNIAERVVHPSLVGAGMTEAALRVLPLDIGWSDSVTLVETGPGGTRTVPGEMAVVGEERLSTGAGGYDCWVVSLATAAGRVTYWIARRERVVVRSVQLLPDGGMLQYTLVRTGS